MDTTPLVSQYTPSSSPTSTDTPTEVRHSMPRVRRSTPQARCESCTPRHQMSSPRRAVVSVIAPGGGTGVNYPVYSDLGCNPRFRVDIIGKSRAVYDCYPEEWPHGGPSPNLRTFAAEVFLQGIVERSDALVVGSRGGQVVLPSLWSWGVNVPPTVVINGGCAMHLPTATPWPEDATTFLLVGGQDNFRGSFSPEEYVADVKSHVPSANSTTAILYVNEMQHMPQANLLGPVLPLLLQALLHWRQTRQAPTGDMRLILAALRRGLWSGRLLYTWAPGKWEDISFSPFEVCRSPTSDAVDADAARKSRVGRAQTSDALDADAAKKSQGMVYRPPSRPKTPNNRPRKSEAYGPDLVEAHAKEGRGSVSSISSTATRASSHVSRASSHVSQAYGPDLVEAHAKEGRGSVSSISSTTTRASSHVSRASSHVSQASHGSEPQEFTRSDELRAIFKAAVYSQLSNNAAQAYSAGLGPPTRISAGCGAPKQDQAAGPPRASTTTATSIPRSCAASGHMMRRSQTLFPAEPAQA